MCSFESQEAVDEVAQQWGVGIHERLAHSDVDGNVIFPYSRVEAWKTVFRCMLSPNVWRWSRCRLFFEL